MAFFRRTFSRRLLPDRFQEITERVYVFDCCLSTKEVGEHDYKSYMDTAVSNLQKHHPGASFMVFNFKEGDEPSLLSDILSHHDMTVVDYPRHYEGYPILPLEMIHYFLRSSDSWLSLEGQRNVILMHCERGGWPALAFMLAGLLLYSKKQVGEMKTLDMVLRNAPKELLTPLSLMNPRPSELRYLQYISGRSLTSDWPPSDTAPLVIQSIVLTNVPLFDGGKGCRPVVHVYAQDSSMKSNTRPRLLCSSLMSEDGAHYYKKEKCLLVKINLNCRVQGDVFLECIHLGDDLVSEEKIFKVMFHTAFVESYTMLLGASEVDVLNNANCKVPNDFKVEVFFFNPEEVQLRIAKEMASLESGHESESEFFEAEEFDISASQDHNNDNLMDKEIMSSNFTLEDTPLDHHNEHKQEDLDFSSFKSIVVEDEIQILDAQSSFDNKAQNQQSIEATVSQEQNSEQVLSEVDYVPIHYPSNEHTSYQAKEIDFQSYILNDDEASAGNENIMEVSGSKVQDTSQTVFSVSCNEDEYDLKHADERDSYQAKEIDFQPYILNDDEESAGNENIMEVSGSKVQDTSQTVFSVSCSEDAYDLKQADAECNFEDVVIGSQEDVSEIASSQITYVANKEVAVVEETAVELKDATKSFLLGEENQEDSSNAPNPSEAEFREIEDFSKNVAGESEFEPIIVSKSIVVVNQDEAVPDTVFPKHTFETSNSSENVILLGKIPEMTQASSSEAGSELSFGNKSFLLVEENQEDSSNAPNPSEAQFRETEDFSKNVVEESEFEPIIVSKSIVLVNQESEAVPKAVIPKHTFETINSSENVILLGKIPEMTQASSSEAGSELSFGNKNFLAVEETQENSSTTGSNSNFGMEEVGSEQDCSEISSSEIESESCIMSKSFISIEGSEDSSEAASSNTGSEFLVAQATSSETRSEVSNLSKHIVVVVEDSEEHEVKVQVQPKAMDGGGSKAVHQQTKNKKKPRFADAVAKVTMQRRVVSMWVPRDKQSAPDDMKQKAPVYKWLPKESVSTTEEASKEAN